ncbi:unnamed protein product, partial [Cyprideis torosa]
MFVILLSLVVTIQQTISSGYINSVITTIEKRFEIPSSLSGLVASTYEIGNLGTIIFVSYLGSSRHIPRWIGIGLLVMSVGSIIFVIPHFLSDPLAASLPQSPHTSNGTANLSGADICRITVKEHINEFDRGLGRLSP